MNQVHHQHSLSAPLMPSEHSSEEHLESDRSSNEKRAPHHLHTQSSQATLSWVETHVSVSIQSSYAESSPITSSS
jgi:hypothetical protein